MSVVTNVYALRYKKLTVCSRVMEVCIFIRIPGSCSRCLPQPEQIYATKKNTLSFSYIVIVANVNEIDIVLHVSAFAVTLLIGIDDQ